MKSRILLLSFLLVILALPARPQQTNAPLGKDQVMTLVKAGMGTAELVKLIHEHGIDFELTDDDAQALRHLGAQDAVIQALRAARLKPLTADQVMELVAGGVPADRAAALVKQHGIDFVPDDRYLQTLRLAGGDDALISAVREAGKALEAELDIATSPGAEVYLDGVLDGRAGSRGEMAIKSKPGAHTLKVTLAGKKDFEQDVTLTARQTTSVAAPLVDLAPATSTYHETPAVSPGVSAVPAGTMASTFRIGILDPEKILGATPEGRYAYAQKDYDTIGKLGRSFVASLSDYAGRNGYAYILDAKKVPIYYSAAGVDLTDELSSVYAAGQTVASAPAPASPAPSLGVINFNTAIANSADGKQAFADLQKKYQPRKQEIEQLQQQIQAIQDQLLKQGASLSDAEKTRLGGELADKQKQLKSSTEIAQSDFNKDAQAAMNRIGLKMVRVIGDYAQRNGFTLVLDDAQVPVYYASPDVEITAEIDRCYDGGDLRRAVKNGASGPAQSGKVGFINIQTAIATSAEGKRAFAELQKKYQPRQQEVQQLQGQIQAIQDQLSKQAATLSEEEKKRLSADLADKQKVLRSSSEIAQNNWNKDRDEFVKRIGEKMVRVIGDYAHANGFAVVLDDVQIPIYYVSKGLELTDEILKLYDAANP